MKYNPFRPNSIVTPGMFQGRYDEIQTIQQCLNQAKNENATWMDALEEYKGITKQKGPISDTIRNKLQQFYKDLSENK
ncbi:MAG: hypothetical protein KBD76_10975 [Bacteriovorax sp.]|nr:hypothetical protein [Bacteriovorax sp.]